jgi:diadenylate cyclase
MLEEVVPYVVETGEEGRLPAMRLNSIRHDVDEMLQLFVKDYCRQGCSDLDASQIVTQIHGHDAQDLLRAAHLLGWIAVGEADLHDITVRPRGYRLLKQVAKIPLATADNVVARFRDFTRLSRADEASLMEVEGIGEKRATSIIEGIQRMRNRSVYR